MTSPTASRARLSALEGPSEASRAGTARDVSQTTPWLAVAVIAAATSVVVGVVWDISWHMTIGRDTFWTPAHMAMYFGGLVGGVSSGVVVLKTTFRGSEQERASSVRFWGFRGPLGAWVSIWGAFAMLSSAPFDDWWHNAYGLDVEILSPPHVVLAAGMVALALGAMLVILAIQNRAPEESARRWAVSYAYVAGCVLSFLAIMTTEYSFRTMQHTSLFYRISCAVFPLILVAAGNTTRHRWGATLVAGSYTLIRAVMLWVLPLFPATPKLGPIYQDITHMVPMDFPLLLILPAIAMDLVRQRMGIERIWRLALAQGAVFFATFLAGQWLLAIFLLSPASHNRVFATNTFPYDMPKTSGYFRGEWVNFDGTNTALVTGLVVAFGLALVSACVGAAWSKGLRQVRR
ncbi:MAG: hypothetical protein ABI877_18565 [Gemmatimonadaceae bacterium]